MIAKSDATMLEDKFSVRSAPETPSDDTVGELATPDTTNSLGVAELSVIVSSIVRTIVVEVVAVEDMVGTMLSSTSTAAPAVNSITCKCLCVSVAIIVPA